MSAPPERQPSSSAASARAATASVRAAAARSYENTWTDILRDYLTLTKPEISFLVTVSAFAGFLLGSPASLDTSILFFTLLGTGLCAGGVGMLNHCREYQLDAQMKRTAARPLPAGRIPVKHAEWAGTGLVLAGVGILCPLVNPPTAVLAALTAILYLYVYTPLKRHTKYNTLIGTIPGALPALGGYVAATGTFGLSGWVIFAILVCWQMPHFLSLAWMYRHDYARGNYAMLPVLEPSGDSTAYQMIAFTVLLLGISVLPTVMGPMSWIYLIGVVPLGLWFLVTALQFHIERTGLRARRVLKASIVYIPALVVLLTVDWFL